MAKYLREIALSFEGNTGALWLAHNGIRATFLFDLFTLDYAPQTSCGVAKLVVQFDENTDGLFHCEQLLDVVIIKVAIDVAEVCKTSRDDQIEFFASTLERVITEFGPLFDLDVERAQRIIQNHRQTGFCFDRGIGRRVFDKSRTKSVHLRAQFREDLKLFLEVQGKSEKDNDLIWFANLEPSFGELQRNIGKIEWVDSRLVKVWHKNSRDSWTIHLDTGEVVFHFPLAESGDPHGQYALARLYLSGELVRQDVEAARKLLQLAASQGFKQAKKRLEKLERTC